ncbi:cytochrome P450 78A5-like [Zingiber officinale]|uniref:cytochrome P450 78A5-like n=1 Tax=Zingiber officinale TaxID=94328 RepID=UPI001C4DA56E|nr:cytochrome P450 78A5-like [Zingiber officinale]
MTTSLEMDAASLFLFLHRAALSPIIGFALIAFAVLFFFPGGLSWALTKPHGRSSIPGPPGVAVSAFSGPSAHRELLTLSRSFKATDLMAFSVGFTRFVVSSHPNTAKEILYSSAFADRPVKESAYELLFHRAMGFAPFGDYWRNLRRISSAYLFSPRRIASLGEQRRAIGNKMVSDVRALMKNHGEAEMRRVLHFASLNNVMMSVFGKSYDDLGDGEASELEWLVKEGYALLGVFNWSDHFPFLRWLDLQGVRRRCRRLVKRVNAFVGRLIEQHRDKKTNGKEMDDAGDFVDVLLGLEAEEKLADADMVAVLWEMIFRGTDTVAILLEWALARMVLHPDIQSRAHQEIDSVVGSRPVSDADVGSLPYLQFIIKESLRMHPPGPLLSWARLATRDVHVGSHLVPAGTTAMVNMWAIAHDESLWPDPHEFRPERFAEEDVSVLGSDLRLAPFGAGRRVCPGKAMGLASAHLWLALLLQNFDFFPAPRGVDLSECLKMSLEMQKPLTCMAVSRT